MACKVTTGVRVDDFPPRVSLDWTDECGGRILHLLHKFQMADIWLTNVSTTLFFPPIPNSTTSEQAIALLPTLIRWREWLRASTIFDWKSVYCHVWDACSRVVGGADRACWESFLDMEVFDLTEGKISVLAMRRLPLWLLAKASQREQLSVVWNWFRHFCFLQRILCVLGGCAVHARCVLFENGSKWSVLLLRVVMHDAIWPKCSA